VQFLGGSYQHFPGMGGVVSVLPVAWLVGGMCGEGVGRVLGRQDPGVRFVWPVGSVCS